MKVRALCLLALMVALLTGCGSAGPGTFSSQNYGYNAAHPAGWSGRQASYHWSGGVSPGFEDSDVDIFTGPHGIAVMAFGTASRESLAVYTRATVQPRLPYMGARLSRTPTRRSRSAEHPPGC